MAGLLFASNTSTRRQPHGRKAKSKKRHADERRKGQIPRFQASPRPLPFPVVRKGAPEESQLTSYQRRVFRFSTGQPIYLLTTRSEANCVSPIRRSRSAQRGSLPKVQFITLAEVAVVYPDFVLFDAAEDGGERFWPRLEFVAGGAVGWSSGTVHAGLILKKERAPAVNRGSGERSTT
jgi:hypothetical protein